MHKHSISKADIWLRHELDSTEYNQTGTLNSIFYILLQLILNYSFLLVKSENKKQGKK